MKDDIGQKNNSKLKEFFKKTWKKILKILRLFLNWRFAVSFGMAWMITNGWAYLFVFFGNQFDISWMKIIGTSYVAFLYIPITPEKLITIPIAIGIQKFLFPKDTKTLKEIEGLKIKRKKKKTDKNEEKDNETTN